MTGIARGYRRVVAAATLANLGDGVRVVALPLLVASLTRDPALVAGLTACAYLPWVLFGLPIGALVDRGRPETYMTAAGLGRAVLLTVLVLALAADIRSTALLYGVTFLLGAGEAAYDTAAQSLIPRIVADGELERANGALVTAERLGQDMVGPAAGGALFAVSALLPFGLNAVALALAAALLAGVRTPPPPGDGVPGTRRIPYGARDRGPGIRRVLSEAADGMRWLLRPHLVRTVILTGTALNFFTLAWEATLVLLATGPMGMSEAGYGAMLAAGAVGGVAGAMGTPALVRRFDRRRLQIAVLGACAFADLALAAFPTPVVAAAAWGCTGATFAVWSVLSVTLRQRLVPAGLLGRVNSAARTLGMAAVPLGALAGGAVATAAGLRAPLWCGGVALAALTVLFALRTRGAEGEVTEHAAVQGRPGGG